MFLLCSRNETMARQANRDEKVAPEAGGRGALARLNIAPADPFAHIGTQIDPERRRGRGAVSNPLARFEPTHRHAEDDGWGALEDLLPFKTKVTIERPRKIITTN